MNLLQYTSNEMFSSTELIRKSKNIFDKLSKNEIEKAIILRDGKPSFMLLEFKMYEELISEYIKNKEEIEQLKQLLKDTKEVKEEIPQIKEEEIIQKVEPVKVDNTKIESIDEIENSDLEDVLSQIDNLDISELSKPKTQEEKKDQQLKDFWE